MSDFLLVGLAVSIAVIFVKIRQMRKASSGPAALRKPSRSNRPGRRHDQVEARKAIARMRDAAESGYRRDALGWALAVFGEPGETLPDGDWALGEYQPVSGDPLATIRARLERECHRAITADEMGSWGYEELGAEWSGALAQVVAGLTSRDATQIIQEASANVRRKIGPPPPGYG